MSSSDAAAVLESHDQPPTCEGAAGPADDHEDSVAAPTLIDDGAHADDAEDETTQPVDDATEGASEQGQKRKEPETPSSAEPTQAPVDSQQEVVKKQKSDDGTVAPSGEHVAADEPTAETTAQEDAVQ